MRVVIIGSGNVATILGERMIIADHEVLQVFGRDEEKATILARKLGAAVCTDQQLLLKDADIYLLAVSDTAISAVTGWLRVGDKIVVHTAGSVDMAVLAPCSSHYGVLYPLQTIRKELGRLPQIPFIIDGETDHTLDALFRLAESLSESVHRAGDLKRKQLHVSAVMINNFTNHLCTLAADYCRNENLDFRLLMPLISETALRLGTYAPNEIQTGPAIRNDHDTVAAHLRMLERYPELHHLYEVFTKSINAYYH